MTWLRAKYFDGHSSAQREVELEIGVDGYVRLRGLEQPRQFRLSEVAISERIGSTPRIARFPDGAAAEITDNDAVDDALERLDATSAQHGVHVLEKRWGWAIAAALLLIAIIWAGIQYGIPAAAKAAAMQFPVSADRALGMQALELLDQTTFKPSALPPERQAQLRAMFDRMTAEINDQHEYRLELRQGGHIGANAFALPSGIVVMTDELVKLSTDDRELEAVLAHEIGHVVNRHSLRMLLQNSATTLLMIGLTGDISSASVLVASVPTVLIQTKHSRQFEAEADDYAYAWMDAHQVPHRYFGAILMKLEKKYGSGDNAMPSWLSTHPVTRERIRE